jgi:hypothetical protein
MQRSKLLFVLQLCAGAATSISARAQVTTLVSDRDSTIYSSGANLSNGAGEHLFAGASVHTSTVRRGLLHFDVPANVPAGSVIQRVDLRMNMSQTIAGPNLVRLHRATADWGEGTSHATGGEGGGALATSGDATWTLRMFPSVPWSNAGGDFSLASSAECVVDQDGLCVWNSTPALVADVQQWLDAPAANFGWFVIHADEASQPSAKRFDSRENSNPALRPRLTIEFTPPACGLVTSYCVAGPNSVGTGALLAHSGSTSLAANAFVLEASQLPAGTNHLFFLGSTAAQIPFGAGYRCIAAPIARLGPPAVTSAAGTASRVLDFTAPPLLGSLSPGDVRDFQCWYRDPAGGGTGQQLSDALSARFCP